MMYYFDRYQLDIPRRKLVCDGKSVPLRPKVFALLVLLIEQRDRVVDKQTLFSEVWPGRIVSDATLSSCIKELRKALDDNDDERRYVGTVHGQGFRFIANVEQSTANPEVLAQPTEVVDIVDAVEQPQPEATLPAPDLIPRNPERKTVSALRCALLHADEEAERLDPESMHRLMLSLLQEVRQSVERYGGHVTQWLSDGCLALFGAPMSHDDDARRAVLAASDLLSRCRAIVSEYDVAFGCGVTSGVTVVGGVPGGPNKHYSASGALLRHAERLCFAANNSEIVIDSATYQLVRGDVRAQPYLDSHQANTSEISNSADASTPVTGLTDAWRVTSVVATRAGVPHRFRRPLTPMVGRKRELALLRERLEDARLQRGQGVALVGPAGIGKTRLFDEFRRNLDNTVSTIVVRCLPELQHQTDFLLQQCARALILHNSDSEQEFSDSRRGESTDLTHHQHHISQDLIQGQDSESLLSNLIARSPGITSNSSLSPQAQRDITENALIRLLFQADGVTVLIVEDLDWIDSSSAALLGKLVQHIGNQRFLLLTSYRSGKSPDWLRHTGITQLSLSPFTETDAVELLNGLPGRELDDVVKQRIVEASGGNPFLLSELALQDIDSGGLPVTVQAVLSARIDELSATDKHVLKFASVIGLRIDMLLLAAVIDIESDTLQESLERLQACELLGIEFDTNDEWLVFRHALVQEATYSMLLSEERLRLHKRIVNCFDSSFAEAIAAHPEIVARHCELAGFSERAARLWQRAALQASKRCAYIETAMYVQRGLALLPNATQHEPTAEQLAGRTRDSIELELALLHSLGHAQMATHGYASRDVVQTWMRAQALCEELGDDTSLFRVLIGLGNYHLASGEVARTISINHRLMRIARRESSVFMRIRARAAMGELMLHLGRMRSSIRHFDSCVALIESQDRLNFLGNSAAVLAHTHLAWARMHMGEDSAALVHSDLALTIAHASDKPILLTMALGMTAKLHRFRHDVARAAMLARETIQIAEKQKFTYWHGSALVTLGWTQACDGDTSAGLSTIHQGIEMISGTGERLMQPVRLSALADAQRMQGLHTLAARTLNEAFELAQSSGERFCLTELQRVQRLLPENTQSNAGGEK